jgi:hypothetical protein
MQALGLFLIAVGFLGGSYVAVLDPKSIDWSWFVPFAACGAIGVALVQIGSRLKATAAERLAANVRDIDESLAELIGGIDELDRDKETLDVYELPGWIDRRFASPIGRFVEARESLIHVHDVATYADVMSSFAAAERYLGRVWSAASEGYVDEANTYVGRAREELHAARQRLEQARAGRAPPGESAPAR